MSQKISNIFDDGVSRNYDKGQIVLYQGEKTEEVFYITSGYVKLYDITAQGNEKLMLILGPGDFFPLVWTFRGNESLHYFYETFSDVELTVISRNELIADIKNNHKLTIRLLKYFVDRTKDLMMRIDCIESSSSKFKIAQVLMYLAESHGEKIAKDTYKLPFKITHQSIADMAGNTRVTASNNLKALQKQKVFDEKNSQIIIHTDRINNLLNEN